MKGPNRWLAGVFSVVSAAMFLGCDSGTAKKSTKGPTTGVSVTSGQGQEMPHEDEDHSHGTALSAEDQVLADAQKLCPVSGEELGGMGTPFKMIVKGEPIFLCCSGCEKKVNADPEKYLAQVAELKKPKPEESKPEAGKTETK